MPQRHATFFTALNATDAGQAPQWVELIPAPDAGGVVAGRDGRSWTFDQAALNAVAGAFATRDVHPVIDYHHATQLRAPQGGEAPAAGWIEDVESRDGALWGRVRWTARAAEEITGLHYRYLSPVFDYDATGRIQRLVGAGLTNTPNLRLTALNHEETLMTRSANLVAAITGALGLTADAADDAVATALNQLKQRADTATALNSQGVDLTRYVPRTDFDALSQRALNAEQALKQHTDAAHTAAVDAALAQAQADGKFAPASEPVWRAMCQEEGGLERFNKIMAVTVALPAAQASGLEGKAPPASGNATALNAEERLAAQALGIPEADYAAHKQKDVK